MKSYYILFFASLLGLFFVSSGSTSSGEQLISENITSSGNLAASQALNLGDLHGKITKEMINIIQEGKSNLTKMTEIAFDKLAAKGLITEKEKETLSPYILGHRISTNNFTTVGKEISSVLKDFYNNNSSETAIGLTSILNSSIYIKNDVVFRESAGAAPWRWDVFCAVLGGELGGGPGAAIGAGECSALAAEGLL